MNDDEIQYNQEEQLKLASKLKSDWRFERRRRLAIAVIIVAVIGWVTVLILTLQ